jgi:hypothetical protein
MRAMIYFERVFFPTINMLTVNGGSKILSSFASEQA